MKTRSNNLSSESVKKLKEQAHQFRRDYVDFWVKNMSPMYLSADDRVIVVLNKLIETITDFSKLFAYPPHPPSRPNKYLLEAPVFSNITRNYREGWNSAHDAWERYLKDEPYQKIWKELKYQMRLKDEMGIWMQMEELDREYREESRTGQGSR